MIRFEQVNREIIDDDMAEMLRNNPPDVVYTAFAQAFFQGCNPHVPERQLETSTGIAQDTKVTVLGTVRHAVLVDHLGVPEGTAKSFDDRAPKTFAGSEPVD